MRADTNYNHNGNRASDIESVRRILFNKNQAEEVNKSVFVVKQQLDKVTATVDDCLSRVTEI